MSVTFCFRVNLLGSEHTGYKLYVDVVSQNTLSLNEMQKLYRTFTLHCTKLQNMKAHYIQADILKLYTKLHIRNEKHHQLN